MDFTADRKTECIWATDIHSYFLFDEFQKSAKALPFFWGSAGDPCGVAGRCWIQSTQAQNLGTQQEQNAKHIRTVS
jgi:hypothetical protein